MAEGPGFEGKRVPALWAKSDPYHPLWSHLLDTAAVCGSLTEAVGSMEEIPQLCIC